MNYNMQGSKVQNPVDDIEIIAGGQRFNEFVKNNTKETTEV